MKDELINGNDLLALGYPANAVMKECKIILETHLSTLPKEQALEKFKLVLEDTQAFTEDDIWKNVAKILLSKPAKEIIELKELSNSGTYNIFGQEYIEPGAKQQMQLAMRLPITHSGALMPDAHQGYGLPIGGVLATDNAVIPYGVGVDIGCRMCLSILDIPLYHFDENASKFKRELIAHTVFGAGAPRLKNRADHAVLHDPAFDQIPFLKQLQEKAAMQLGTSGSGNHFVEWGIVKIQDEQNEWNLPTGKYVGILSHSGSRGLGAQVAGHYTKLAEKLCSLPQEVKRLAYLSLDSQEGQEYWLAMELAGNYASACHYDIHQRLVEATGAEVLARVENHHNFAWKEQHGGKDLIVHRKGATPAGKGVLGIIPGSMTAPGFIVKGRGLATALDSASHGAGRLMSRKQALIKNNWNELRSMLKDHNVTLIGAGLDEAPTAYKNINQVMQAQSELVDIVGTFKPRIVRMADA